MQTYILLKNVFKKDNNLFYYEALTKKFETSIISVTITEKS